MKNNETPLCSIIVLNYFGEKVIKDVVLSLEKLNFAGGYEIIIVDNGSKDKSEIILRELASQFSNIRLIFSPKNLGFSKGNNLGIKTAKGKYIILLNNDCIVDKDFLSELVKIAKEDEKIFSVGPKILLYPKYIELALEVSEGALLTDAYLSDSNINEIESNSQLPIKINLIDNIYSLEFTFDPVKDKFITLNILIDKSNSNRNQKQTPFLIKNIDKSLFKVIDFRRKGREVHYKVQLSVEKKYLDNMTFDLIQNAGIVVFQNGYGRDIGSIVKMSHQRYERDMGQYQDVREVYATCGAAVLYKKNILEKIGYLDENFFMYYEDDEICERARFFGYKSYFNPKAVVRHRHALSSKEWSTFFIYHAEKGRLLHMVFNFPLRIFIKEYIKFAQLILTRIIKAFIMIRLLFKQLVLKTSTDKSKEDSLAKNIQLTRVWLYFLFNLPQLLIKRSQKYNKKQRNDIEKNYQDILSGRWYF